MNIFWCTKEKSWGKTYSSAEESTVIDFETIKNVDLVCVIPGVPHSGGVHVEIGWASANKKPLKIFLKKDYPYSPMVTGINMLTSTNYIFYDNDYDDDLIEQIINEIKQYFNL